MAFWHFTWHVFWHSIRHIFWNSVWHIFWHFFLAIYLAYPLTFDVAYLLAYLLASYLANLLALNLNHTILSSGISVWHIFWLFFLAYLSGISSDIRCGISSGISSGILPGKSSGIQSLSYYLIFWHIFWNSIWQIFLTYLLTSGSGWHTPSPDRWGKRTYICAPLGFKMALLGPNWRKPKISPRLPDTGPTRAQHRQIIGPTMATKSKIAHDHLKSPLQKRRKQNILCVYIYHTYIYIYMESVDYCMAMCWDIDICSAVQPDWTYIQKLGKRDSWPSFLVCQRTWICQVALDHTQHGRLRRRHCSDADASQRVLQIGKGTWPGQSTPWRRTQPLQGTQSHCCRPHLTPSHLRQDGGVEPVSLLTRSLIAWITESL